MNIRQHYRLATRDGQDTLHKFPAFEECNLDDAKLLVDVTEDEGWDAVTSGDAHACEYCFPLPNTVYRGG